MPRRFEITEQGVAEIKGLLILKFKRSSSIWLDRRWKFDSIRYMGKPCCCRQESYISIEDRGRSWIYAFHWIIEKKCIFSWPCPFFALSLAFYLFNKNRSAEIERTSLSPILIFKHFGEYSAVDEFYYSLTRFSHFATGGPRIWPQYRDRQIDMRHL